MSDVVSSHWSRYRYILIVTLFGSVLSLIKIEACMPSAKTNKQTNEKKKVWKFLFMTDSTDYWGAVCLEKECFPMLKMPIQGWEAERQKKQTNKKKQAAHRKTFTTVQKFVYLLKNRVKQFLTIIKIYQHYLTLLNLIFIYKHYSSKAWNKLILLFCKDMLQNITAANSASPSHE